MQAQLLENGLGEILTEAWWQPWKSLPAWEHVVPSTHQRLVK